MKPRIALAALVALALAAGRASAQTTPPLRWIHPGYIGTATRIDMNGDGGLAATLDRWGGQVRVWDTPAGTLRWIIPTHIPYVADMTFSRETDALAIIGYWIDTAGDFHGTLEIWDARTGTLTASVETKCYQPTHVEYNGVTGAFVVGGYSNAYGVAEALTEPWSELGYPAGLPGELYRGSVMGFSGIAALGFSLFGSGTVGDVTMISDGTWVYLCEPAPFGLVGKIYWPYTTTLGIGSSVIAGGGRGSVSFQDVLTGGQWQLNPDYPVNTFAFSPDGKLATVSETGDVNIWDWNYWDTPDFPGTPVRSFHTSGGGTSITWAQNRNEVAVAGGAAELWYVSNPFHRETTFGSYGMWFVAPQALAVTPDATQILTANSWGDGSSGAALWNVSNGGQTQDIRPQSYWGGYPVCVAASPQAGVIAVGGKTAATVSSLDILDYATKAPISHIQLGGQGFVAAAFSPDGSLIAVANGGLIADGGSVGVYRVSDGTLLRSSPMTATYAVPSLVFSPDGAWLAAGGDTTDIWRTSDWTHVAGGISGGQRLVFSPDSTSLLVRFDQYIFRYAVPSGTYIDTLDTGDDEYHHYCNALTFSPDGSTLWVGNGLYLQVFSAATFDRLARYDQQPDGTIQSCYGIAEIAFVGPGDRVAYLRGDGGLALMDNPFYATLLSNRAPTAAPVAFETPEDTPKSFALAGSDPDGDALTYVIVTPPAHGALSGAAPDLTYTPAPDTNGSDSFTYRASDGKLDSSVATVSITVTPVNDAPAAAGQAVTTDEDTAKAITLAGSDVDGDTLTYLIVTPPAKGTLSGSAPNLTYAPNANANGSDSFTFRVNDGTLDSAPAAVSITINPVNDPPDAADDTASTTLNTPVTVPVLYNDTDVDGETPVVSAVTAPAHGTAVINPDGTVTYTPVNGFSGTDSFRYTIRDAAGATATAAVTVGVTLPNRPPHAVTDIAATSLNTPVKIAVLANDGDPDGDPLRVVSVTPADGGNVTINADGTVTYTPDANTRGRDTFTYTISDGRGGKATGRVNVTIR